MIKNINEYEQSKFEPQFKKTKLYRILEKDFDCVAFSKQWNYPKTGIGDTPRKIYSDQSKSLFSAVPFYYLEFLTRKNPKTIYDLGCGWNIFKKYIPNIIGIGAEDPNSDSFYGDIHDYVDDDFISNHQNYFESVFSINSLHFVPLSNLQKTVGDFYSMLQPDGVGWLALHIQRMIERDADNFHDKDRSYLDRYVRRELSDLNIDYLVFDLDLAIVDEFMDGNIRLVMQKAS